MLCRILTGGALISTAWVVASFPPISAPIMFQRVSLRCSSAGDAAAPVTAAASAPAASPVAAWPDTVVVAAAAATLGRFAEEFRRVAAVAGHPGAVARRPSTTHGGGVRAARDRREPQPQDAAASAPATVAPSAGATAADEQHVLACVRGIAKAGTNAAMRNENPAAHSCASSKNKVRSLQRFFTGNLDGPRARPCAAKTCPIP